MQNNCLCKALYDNNSESPDELQFRKGDILTVLEQNPDNLEGWWLCSLRGRQGIAPGNRLRILPGRYDPSGLGYAGSTSMTGGASTTTGLGMSTVSPSGSTGSLKMSPPRPCTPSGTLGSRRRSWHINCNKVVTPQRIGDVYLYDVPTTQGAAGTAYDIPPSRPLRSTSSTPSPNHSLVSLIALQPPKSPAPNASSGDGCCTSTLLIKADPMETNLHGLLNGSKSISTELQLKLDIGTDVAYDVPLPARRPVASHDLLEDCNYDVPPPPVKAVVDQVDPQSDLAYDVPKSNRSSGVISGVSSSSSSLLLLSPQSNCSSLGANSVSFSSHGGSNRSSLEQPSAMATGEVYDVPPPRNPRPANPATELRGATSSPTPLTSSSSFHHQKPKVEECYDVPNGTPEIVASNTSLDQLYDMPRVACYSAVQKEGKASQDTKRASTYSNESRDSAFYSSIANDSICKPLNIDLNEGITLVVKHQQFVHCAINDLFTLIGKPNWRQKDNLTLPSLSGLQDACCRLRLHLKDFLEFTNGVYANALNASDKGLSNKMSNLLLQLTNSNSIIQTATAAIDEKGWTVERLCVEPKGSPTAASKTPDELDQLVACARGLTEDVKHINSFIRGNAKLLFKEAPLLDGTCTTAKHKPPVLPKPANLRSLPSVPPPAPPRNPNLQSRPLPPVPGPVSVPNTEVKVDSKEAVAVVVKTGTPVATHPEEDEVDEGANNDYDYVSLESKESVNSRSKETLKIAYSPPLASEKSGNRSDGGEDEKESDTGSVYGRLCDAYSVDIKEVGKLTSKRSKEHSERQLLMYYCAQLELHKCFLTNAIDAFIYVINQNEPPKVFIEHSKFVIIAAQKMIYMGDTVSRNLDNDTRNQIGTCATTLCDYLKSLVTNTKKAALQFPSVSAVQEMVDCVVDVSHAANNLHNTMMKSLKL